MSRTLDPAAQRRTGRGFPEEVATSHPLDRGVAERAARDSEHPFFRVDAEPRPAPEGTEPVVLRAGKRGVLHRGWRDAAGKLHGHPRCHALPASEVLPPVAAYYYDNLRDTARYCRYPWCFRALVNEMGIIPVVGHHSRKLGKRRLVATTPVADDTEPGVTPEGGEL